MPMDMLEMRRGAMIAVTAPCGRCVNAVNGKMNETHSNAANRNRMSASMNPRGVCATIIASITDYVRYLKA